MFDSVVSLLQDSKETRVIIHAPKFAKQYRTVWESKLLGVVPPWLKGLLFTKSWQIHLNHSSLVVAYVKTQHIFRKLVGKFMSQSRNEFKQMSGTMETKHSTGSSACSLT